MLTSVPVAAFDFCQAFHDPMRQHSPKLIRICVDSCFKSFWPLSGILFFSSPLCSGCWMQAPQYFFWCLLFCAVLAPGAWWICVFCFLLRINCCKGSFLLMLMCGYWMIEKEMSSVVFYQWRLCLGLFLNLTCTLNMVLHWCLKMCLLHSSHHDCIY